MLSVSLKAKELFNVISHWVCNILIFYRLLYFKIILKKDLGIFILVLNWYINKLLVLLSFLGILIESDWMCKYSLKSFLMKDSEHEYHNFKYCKNTSNLCERLYYCRRFACINDIHWLKNRHVNAILSLWIWVIFIVIRELIFRCK